MSSRNRPGTSGGGSAPAAAPPRPGHDSRPRASGAPGTSSRAGHDNDRSRSNSPSQRDGRSRSNSPRRSTSRSPARPSECGYHIRARFDGGCTRDGPDNVAGAGAVVYLVDPHGSAEEIWSASLYVGRGKPAEITNNTAEYAGAILALEQAMLLAAYHDATRVRVEGDSDLVIGQIRGGCQV